MLRRSLPLTALAVVLGLGLAAPAGAQTAAQGALLERALDAASAGDRIEAEALGGAPAARSPPTS